RRVPRSSGARREPAEARPSQRAWRNGRTTPRTKRNAATAVVRFRRDRLAGVLPGHLRGRRVRARRLARAASLQRQDCRGVGGDLCRPDHDFGAGMGHEAMASSVGSRAERLTRVRSLRTVKGRRRQQRLSFEGPTLLAEAHAAGFPIEELYATQAAYDATALAREL